MWAANCETVAAPWAPGGPSGMVSHADQSEASPSLRVANCEITATIAGSWEAQRSGVIRRPERSLPVPAGCELRNCHHFRVVLGGPAQWCHTQTRMRPRRPCGLRGPTCFGEAFKGTAKPRGRKFEMSGHVCSRLLCTKGWVRPLVSCFRRVSWEPQGSFPRAFLGPVGP